MAATIEQPGEAGTSAVGETDVLVIGDDLSNSNEQLTTSGTGSEGEQEEEQAEEAAEGGDLQKEELMEE